MQEFAIEKAPQLALTQPYSSAVEIHLLPPNSDKLSGSLAELENMYRRSGSAPFPGSLSAICSQMAEPRGVGASRPDLRHLFTCFGVS